MTDLQMMIYNLREIGREVSGTMAQHGALTTLKVEDENTKKPVAIYLFDEEGALIMTRLLNPKAKFLVFHGPEKQPALWSGCDTVEEAYESMADCREYFRGNNIRIVKGIVR